MLGDQEAVRMDMFETLWWISCSKFKHCAMMPDSSCRQLVVVPPTENRLTPMYVLWSIAAQAISASRQRMSASPPKADIRRLASICPLRAITGCEQSQQNQSLFDYLVGAGEQLRWHVEAKRLRGLEVDHQLVLGWRLYRKVGRLLALEDAVDIAGRASVLVNEIGAIGDQAGGNGVGAFIVDRGQLVPSCQRDNQVPMNRRQRA